MYGPQGLIVWAIASQEPDDTVARFAEQLDLNLPILLDRDGTVWGLYEATLGSIGAPYPQEWIIGRDGRVAYYTNRLELDAAIEVIEAELEQ